MRYSSDWRSVSKESYNKFCATYSSVSITFEQYKEIIYDNNAQYMHYILSSGEAVPLPWGLGKVSINRKKTQTLFTGRDGVEHIILPVDWPASKASGKKVYYFNDHTDGWKTNWIWFKTSSTGLKMKDIWEFRPAKIWKGALKDYTIQKDYLYKYTEWPTTRAKKKKN